MGDRKYRQNAAVCMIKYIKLVPGAALSGSAIAVAVDNFCVASMGTLVQAKRILEIALDCLALYGPRSRPTRRGVVTAKHLHFRVQDFPQS